MDDYQNSCSALIKQINDSLEKNANNTLRAEDLTISQIAVLIALDQASEQTLSMKNLQERFGVAQPTMFGTVKRLETKGLVNSFANPEDGRMKLVRLTQAGKKKCDTGYVHMEDTERQLLMTLTDTEQQQFRQILKKIRRSLS